MAKLQLAEKTNLLLLKDKVEEIRDDLKIPADPMEVHFVIDESPSMEFPQRRFFSQGIVSGLSRRVLAFAMEFDRDGKVPCYFMSEGVRKVREDITRQNLDTYIDTHYRGGSGTDYAPAMEQLLHDIKPGPLQYVAWFTDGETSNEDRISKIIAASSNLPIFWQFFGIYGDERRPNFGFLERLDDMSGRRVDNVDFKAISLHNTGDDELFRMMLEEFGKYPAKAKAAGVLPWPQGITWQQLAQQHGLQKRGGLFGSW